MDALARTAAITRTTVPMANLVKQSRNPNKMSPREFDLLVDNIEKVGLVDPLFVRPVDGKGPDGGPMYRIVGGEHRYDAAVFLGFTEAPVTIVAHDDFDEDAETFQVLRMNVIRGKIDAAQFFAMYQRMSDRYADEVLQDAFGFAEEAEFRKLIEQSAKALPTPAMRQKFKEAAAEIRTIDGLAALLNQMFTTYGSTLPYGYMIIDYGGQRSVWLQVSKRTMEAVDLLGSTCMEFGRTMDDVFGEVVRRLARGDLPEVLQDVIAKSPPVKLPGDMVTQPTKDAIAKVESLKAE